MTAPDSALQQALASSYRFERELGRGGMAVVYLAHDLKHDRRIALKVIRPDVAFAGAAERFSREIKLAARLQHPHILPVHDSGEAGGQLWYTMPFVDGESLRDRLDREGKLAITEAIRIVREAAQALAYAHEHSVIHRDIKPENLLLSGDGSLLVADFGIARAIAGPTAPTAQAALTETGIAVGTPAYMAPEVRLGAPADARSEIYSLAAVLYELLTGKMLTPQGGLGVDLFMPDTVPLVRAVRAEVPPEVDAVVRRGLHPNPEQRFGSMAEFGAALAGDGIAHPAVRRWPLLTVPLIALVAVGLSAFLLWKTLGGQAETTATTTASLAILPFEDAGGDTTDAYFGQGMADELTTTLAQLPGLRVAGRSAVARLSGETDVRKAGRELGVASILAGSVRRSGGRLRVNVELSDVGSGLVLWAGRYDRAMGDIFTVQDEMTRAIATALEPQLLGFLVSSHATPNLEAYDLYLRGRYFWSRRGREGLHKAIQYFNQAIAADPSLARAHAGLSMAYVVLPVFDTLDPDSSLTMAERSAARALALDSSLAEANLALAYVLKNRWRFPESEREFRAALALAPNDATIPHWYGVMLYAVGRVEESVNQLTRARELDPFGSTIATDGAVALYGAGRLAESRAELARSYQLDSTKSDTQFMTGLVELAAGRLDSALYWLRAARRLGTGFDVRSYESVAYRRMGRVKEADSLVAAVQESYRRGGPTTPYDLAIAATAAGNRALALEAIQQTITARSLLVTELTLPCDPLLDPLKSDPRLETMLRAAGMTMCPARS
jgi:TolB-like protein